jgi:hypothetical protein
VIEITSFGGHFIEDILLEACYNYQCGLETLRADKAEELLIFDLKRECI